MQKLLYQQHKVNLLENLSFRPLLDSSLLRSFPSKHHSQHYSVAKKLVLLKFYLSNRSPLAQIPIKPKKYPCTPITFGCNTLPGSVIAGGLMNY